MTEKSKATTEPWYSCLLRHPARKWSRVYSGTMHTYLLAPDPHEA